MGINTDIKILKEKIQNLKIQLEIDKQRKVELQKELTEFGINTFEDIPLKLEQVDTVIWNLEETQKNLFNKALKMLEIIETKLG